MISSGEKNISIFGYKDDDHKMMLPKTSAQVKIYDGCIFLLKMVTYKKHNTTFRITSGIVLKKNLSNSENKVNQELESFYKNIFTEKSNF